MEDIIVINNQEFLIIDRVNYLDRYYLYVIAIDGSNKFTILEESNQDGKTFIQSVKDSELVEEILKLIVKKEVE